MTKPRVPFQPPKSCKAAVQESMTKLLSESQRRRTESILSPHNMLHYSHGLKWSHPADPNDEPGKMESHSAEVSLPFSRLVCGDLALITEAIDGMSEEFHNQLMQSMYSLVNRTCEKTGNSVKASQANFPDAFEKMLERIEFGVDQYGEVSLPTVHTADAKWMMQALESQPDEYHQRIQKLIERKSLEAREQETARKKKFAGKD